MTPYDCDPWAAENPYEEAWQDQYCSSADAWGPYIWIAIGVAVVVLLFLIYRSVKARGALAPGSTGTKVTAAVAALDGEGQDDEPAATTDETMPVVARAPRLGIAGGLIIIGAILLGLLAIWVIDVLVG